MRKENFIILLGLFLLCSEVHSTEFVNLKVGARALGMGGAFTAISDDANLLQYNPAGLAFLKRKELMISYLGWLADMDTEYLSYVHPGLYKGLNFGVGIHWFDLTMPKTDLKGVEMGDVKIREYLTALSFSSKIRDNIGIGTNIKIVNSTLGRYSSMALLVDAGILMIGPGFDIGAAVTSLHLTPFRYKEVDEEIPTQFRVGVARFMRNMVIAVDGVKEMENMYVNAGLEYIIIPELAVQVGYRVGYDIKGLSLGARVNLSGGLEDEYILNVAYAPMSDISDVYSASFNIRFR